MASQNQFDSLMRELELERENAFESLLQDEEELESKVFPFASLPRQSSSAGDPEIKWLQQALNRVSAFGIAEDGVLSVQTRRALQKFQSEQGIKPSGKMGPRTRAALIEASGMLAPKRAASPEREHTYGEMEVPSDQCPPDSPFRITGFPRYSDDVQLLPDDQKKKLADIALQISTLASGLPDHTSGSLPTAQVLLIGHADMDAARESQAPGFLQFLSEKRAASVYSELCSRMQFSLVARVQWIEVGLGASSLAVSPARTEAQRRCNRRVEIRISPNGEPALTRDQHIHVDGQFQGPNSFTEFYGVALQGTSGQYENPRGAEQKAREIALRIDPFLRQRGQETGPACARFLGIQGAFKDALQGTASKYSDPDVVISKAYEIAQRSQFGGGRALRKLQWQSASLPQPMSPDCVVVRGQVPGPPSHVLCGTHGHILDVSSRTVIAHDLGEYKRKSRR